MKTIREILMDINNRVLTKLEAKQDDVNSRFIQITLLDGNNAINLTGNTVKIFGVKADNTKIFNDVEITDATNGVILIELTNQALAVAGELQCELVIYGSENSVLSSKVFTINVLESIRDDSAIESTDEFTALTQGINKLEAWDQQFQAKYDGLNTQYASQLISHTSQLANIATDVDLFGAYGDGVHDDSMAIQNAIDFAGDNGIIRLSKNKIYLIKNGIVLHNNQTIYGYGATLKRCDESKTTLSSQADYTSSQITVNNVPTDWKAGDTIHIYTGNSINMTTDIKTISDINGNVITLNNSIGKFINSSNNDVYPIGTGVRKVFIMVSSQQYPTPAVTKVYGVTFNGSKNHNSSNYYWYLNSCLSVYGFGTEVCDCKFINTPNENIITHGAKITNNYAENLNGSFVHLSSPPSNLGAEFMGTIITNNVVKKSNTINPTITGHSLAVIEQSWNAGKTIINSNYFEGNSLAICFDLITQNTGSSTSYYDEFIVTNNIFKNYSKITRDINSYITWDLNNRIVTSNLFINCGSTDLTNMASKNIIFKNNLLSGTTTVSGDINIDKSNHIVYSDTIASISLQSTDGTFTIAHFANGSTYFQKGSKQYMYVDSNDNLILNKDAKILNPLSGVVNVGDFNRFITDTMTSAPWRNYLNSTYQKLSIGSEVYFPNIPTPAIYIKVGTDSWVTIQTTIF
ncbi:BppU family phage baseplate upper protein [Clostridium sp. YIM B02505]|uniref:BppU family phage baseplate upper protein n=1 Tax=Clostridium yunnanense TaxID=2800325 RepID=A0ABS1EJ44_9CLOT|nr:BppU family phage baseplate upper protein [Clostridium yunnanense]MBK1809338.1 BppU family phage baseplate upper protein [Clostridium yunnanense]